MNAAVVGILFAAFITPVVTSAILRPIDAALALGPLLLLLGRVPTWVVVIATAAIASVAR